MFLSPSYIFISTMKNDIYFGLKNRGIFAQRETKVSLWSFSVKTRVGMQFHKCLTALLVLKSLVKMATRFKTRTVLCSSKTVVASPGLADPLRLKREGAEF
jgi:hypothetical protein